MPLLQDGHTSVCGHAAHRCRLLLLNLEKGSRLQEYTCTLFESISSHGIAVVLYGGQVDTSACTLHLPWAPQQLVLTEGESSIAIQALFP